MLILNAVDIIDFAADAACAELVVLLRNASVLEHILCLLGLLLRLSALLYTRIITAHFSNSMRSVYIPEVLISP